MILVVLAAAFAVEGYRQGFVVGALGVIGFLGGAAAGAVVSPGIAQALTQSRSQRALAAIVVAVPASPALLIETPELFAVQVMFVPAVLRPSASLEAR